MAESTLKLVSDEPPAHGLLRCDPYIAHDADAIDFASHYTGILQESGCLPRFIFQTNQNGGCLLQTPCIREKDLNDVLAAANISGTYGDSIGAIFRVTRFCRELPPYVLEFYHEVLRLWKAKLNPSVPSLYEMCLLRIGRIRETSSIVPAFYIRCRVNHIIHRVLRRMLDRFNEACMFEKFTDTGLMRYPRADKCLNALDLWLNRSRYLKQKTCPVERAKDYVKLMDLNSNHAYQEPYMSRYTVRIHQHNYFRCTCPFVHPVPRLPRLPKKEKKVSKELRAAQRAEQRARRR